MSVAHRSSSSVNYATRTNTVITAPTGIVNNDSLLIIFEIGASGVSPPVPTPPSGFSVVTGFPVSRSDNNPFTVSTYAWTKLAASESGDYTVTHASASSNAYMVAAFGQDLVTPLSPNPTVTVGSGASATATGVTTTRNGCLIVYFCSKWDFPGITPPGGTTPTFTTRLDGSTTLLFVSDGVLSPQGATGNKTATGLPDTGDPIDPNVTGLISIQPAAASGTGGWAFEDWL